MMAGAIADYRKVILLNPQHAQAYFNMAMAQQNTGQLKEACSNFNNALKLGYADAQNLINKYCQ